MAAGSGGVISSFWNTKTSGVVTSLGGTASTTAEMQLPATYAAAGWSGTKHWTLANGAYPAPKLLAIGACPVDNCWIGGAGGWIVRRRTGRTGCPLPCRTSASAVPEPTLRGRRQPV